ncbi:MAG: cupin domain-containing protein [Ignavibacteria bacterium]|nr:cupin domain-containing protein [Ignavibacteria bacterium]
MNHPKGNIFDNVAPSKSGFEAFEKLAGTTAAHVERIISNGQKTPEGKWLQQERNEWVVLIDGNAGLSFDDGEKLDLKPGDYVFIPKDTKHRVDYTSEDPPCIWLAFHFN